MYVYLERRPRLMSVSCRLRSSAAPEKIMTVNTIKDASRGVWYVSMRAGKNAAGLF